MLRQGAASVQVHCPNNSLSHCDGERWRDEERGGESEGEKMKARKK